MTAYEQAIKHSKNHRKDRYTQQCAPPVIMPEEPKEIKRNWDILEILRIIESHRKLAEARIYPYKDEKKDITVREIQALIASEAGYISRAQWCRELEEARAND